jgi:hypothetical protein
MGKINCQSYRFRLFATTRILKIEEPTWIDKIQYPRQQTASFFGVINKN